MGAFRRTLMSNLQGQVKCRGCLNLGCLEGQNGVVKPGQESPMYFESGWSHTENKTHLFMNFLVAYKTKYEEKL